MRTHFHVPLYWDTDEPARLDPARRSVAFLEALRVRARIESWPMLEVETYTWTVLDPSWRPERDLVAGIRAELAFVDRALEGP